LPFIVPVLLLVLAAGARWWPVEHGPRDGGSFLVCLPQADARREAALDQLATYVGKAVGLNLQLRVARDAESFAAEIDEAMLIMCPDGMAMNLPTEAWQPLAAGRRRAPWNLRPRSVLVSRSAADTTTTPWRLNPQRTVFGDSLSLVCLGPVLLDGHEERPDGVAWGGDPYDHRSVLSALAHGAYDYAVVRQFDAEAALEAGVLDRHNWRVRRVGTPVPDVLVMVSRRLTSATCRDLQLTLSVLGRELDGPADRSAGVVAGLGLMGLDGFNFMPMLGNDVDRARRRYGAGWPPTRP